MMDSEVSVLLHCAAWRGLLETQVCVELSDRFNRQTHPSLERQIEEVWTERASREPWLFNGSKFRLHSFCLAPSPSVSTQHPPCTLSPHIPFVHSAEDERNTDSAHNSLEKRHRIENQDSSPCHLRGRRGVGADGDIGEEGEHLLTLRLGLTCYKDYLGTNWSCEVAELRQRGEAEFGDPLALLAQPLGVGAVLCTADGQVVLIRRSQRVAEAGGLLDIPGGHPEPKMVCESLGQEVEKEEQISVDMMEQRAVVSELFTSVCAEVRDEVNIPVRFLSEPVLLGVALNHTSAGRPSAEFYISCSLTSDEVRQLYWKGGAEASESTDIVFISRTEVLQLDRSSSLWSGLCPSAKGAVLLYQMVQPDGDRGLSRHQDIRLDASEKRSR